MRSDARHGVPRGGSRCGDTVLLRCTPITGSLAGPVEGRRKLEVRTLPLDGPAPVVMWREALVAWRPAGTAVVVLEGLSLWGRALASRQVDLVREAVRRSVRRG